MSYDSILRQLRFRSFLEEGLSVSRLEHLADRPLGNGMNVGQYLYRLLKSGDVVFIGDSYVLAERLNSFDFRIPSTLRGQTV